MRVFWDLTPHRSYITRYVTVERARWNRYNHETLSTLLPLLEDRVALHTMCVKTYFALYVSRVLEEGFTRNVSYLLSTKRPNVSEVDPVLRQKAVYVV